VLIDDKNRLPRSRGAPRHRHMIFNCADCLADGSPQEAEYITLCLRTNVRDERVGVARIIFVVIVAQSEVTELDRVLRECFSFDGQCSIGRIDLPFQRTAIMVPILMRGQSCCDRLEREMPIWRRNGFL
jgi:hypothetical protein